MELAKLIASSLQISFFLVVDSFVTLCLLKTSAFFFLVFGPEFGLIGLFCGL
jgi:hypothetical protein